MSIDLRVNNFSDRKRLLLFYTAPSVDKPTYRQGLLDTLCYPNHHIVEYSYRRSQIHSGLLPSVDSLKDEGGVIILVDSDLSGNVTYLPIRRVQILRTTPSTGTLKPPAPRERVRFLLELQDFIKYQDPGTNIEWHERVSAFDVQRSFSSGTPDYFVIPAPEDVFEISPHSVLKAWEDVVNAISQGVLLSDCIFLRLGHIKHAHLEQRELDLTEQGENNRGYLLRPGQVYQLDISVFEKPGSQSRGGELSVSCTSDLVEVDRPRQSVVSGLAERSALIRCKRTLEDALATLTVEVEGPSKGHITAPKPVYLLRTAVSETVLYLFVSLVLTGAFLVSLDQGFFKELWGESHDTVFAVISKLLGAVSLAGAAYLGFRKLPSGK